MAPALRGCALLLCLAVISCGGGGGSSGGGSSSSSTGSTTPASNVATVTVESGPTGVTAINTLYTSVTVCVPNTTTCQAIDHIQVDTGSYGLRILSQALTLSLPVATAAGGGGLVECTLFADGYSWGPVALVDLQIAGETANALPVQLIGDSRYPTAPSDCSSVVSYSENTVSTFGANGILGIGPFIQDCGNTCADGVPEPIAYYACTTSTACTGTTVALTAQVQNPVPMFTTDNNGTIITLPSVSSSGATSVTGTLIFGIDTESNNASGSQTVVPVSDMGFITTTFNGQILDESFVDSGSNATYFSDSNLATCQVNVDFYCPTSLLTLSAAFVLSNSSTVSETFEVANADAISTADSAYPGLAGTIPASSSGVGIQANSSFDWGLPFFYGRRVAYAIDGATTSAGSGPYIAY
jgi:hypothetical protein